MGKRDGMSVSLSSRERTALAAIAAAAPGTVNGVQLRTALRMGGFPGTSVQGAHQTTASLVRKRLVYKDYDARGVRYGPLTVDGTEALGETDAAGYDREVICGGCGDEWNLRPGEDMRSCPSCGSRKIGPGS